MERCSPRLLIHRPIPPLCIRASCTPSFPEARQHGRSVLTASVYLHNSNKEFLKGCWRTPQGLPKVALWLPSHLGISGLIPGVRYLR